MCLHVCSVRCDATWQVHTIPLPLLWPQVAANLGKDGYMADIARETDDISVQVVFCNAGYMITGFFHNRCVSSLSLNDTACAVTSAFHVQGAHAALLSARGRGR